MVNTTLTFLSDIVKKRSVIFELAWRDYQQQYQGSYLGIIWTFLQPLIFVGVLYTIFSLGLRAQSTVDMPFSLYLVSGIICWQYFSSVFSATTNVIRNYSFLVKKVDFRLSILPFVKILGALIPHLFLIFVVVVLAWYKGYPPTFYTLQIIYYFFAAAALLTGLGWLTSSTSLFVKDITNIVAVIIQFGFWLTPIFWNIKMIPVKYQWLVKLNPVYYLVSGYRDSIVLQVPFWERPVEMFYYWIWTFLMLGAGITVYRKLRPHFAEVI